VAAAGLTVAAGAIAVRAGLRDRAPRSGAAAADASVVAGAPTDTAAPSAAGRFGAGRDSGLAAPASARLVDSAARRPNDSARLAARRPPLGALTISAPADAEVYLDGVRVGRGTLRRDGLRPGRHVVRATVASLPGCASADASVVVDLAGGPLQPVALDPLPCGRLDFDVVPTPAQYRLVPLRGGPTLHGVLPLAEPLFIAEGDYALTIEATQCAAYSATVPVVAGRARAERARLICS
jgi:hypothetical protein